MKLSVYKKASYSAKSKEDKNVKKLLYFQKLEYWKNIKELESDFMISSYGRAFKKNNQRFIYPDKKGVIRLSVRDIRKNISVYTLLWSHFIRNDLKLYRIDDRLTYKICEFILLDYSTYKMCVTCKKVKCISNFHYKKGGVGNKSTICSECSSINGSKYYKDNKSRVNAKNKRNYYKNISKYREIIKKWAFNNRDKRNFNARKRSRLNRPYENERQARRKAQQKHAKIIFPLDFEKVTNLYKEAHRLTKETGIKHEVDHIIPLFNKIVCGLHVSWNMQILLKSENSKKGNRLL